MIDRLVLLPGMDGTGDLFAGLASALPSSFQPIVVAYPKDKPLSSSALLVTVHWPGCSTSLHGGDIQFSGLYEPPSEWTSTEPSALTMSSRRADGR